jgi:hypothetical protein
MIGSRAQAANADGLEGSSSSDWRVEPCTQAELPSLAVLLQDCSFQVGKALRVRKATLKLKCEVQHTSQLLVLKLK